MEYYSNNKYKLNLKTNKSKETSTFVGLSGHIALEFITEEHHWPVGLFPSTSKGNVERLPLSGRYLQKQV